MDDDNPRVFVKVVLVAAVFVLLGLLSVYSILNGGGGLQQNQLFAVAAGKNIWSAWIAGDARLNPEKGGAHRYAASLALEAKKYASEMSVKDWVFVFDPLVIDKFIDEKNMPSKIFSDSRGRHLDPDFKRSPLSWSMVLNVPPDLPKDAPVFWTRGLGADGYWSAEDGVFGDKGGVVVFADGRAVWFNSLAEGGVGALKKFGSNEPTANIYEAVFGGEKNVAK